MRLSILLILLSFYSIAGEHYLALGYNLGAIGKFDEVTSSATSGSIEMDIHYESGWEYSYEYFDATPESWGFSAGAKYRPKVGIDKITTDGTSYGGAGDTAEVSSLALYGNAIYRWYIFYIPFGLNITSIEWHKLSSSDSDVTSNSGFGINYGVGWQLTDSFQLEYTVMSSSWDVEFDDGTDIVKYDDGAYTVAALTLKYKFL